MLLNTCNATRRRMKYWAISSGDKSWAVRLDIRDLGGHVDVTRPARAGAHANRVTKATSQAHLFSALPVGFPMLSGCTRSKVFAG